MEFGWSPDEVTYRARVREMLDKNLPDNWESIAAHGPASEEQTQFSYEFCPAPAKEGLLVAHWPKQFGGSDALPWHQFILGEEVWAVGEPRGGQYMNVNWIGPSLMKFGSKA
jgi:alkylation response protein AidB-like acyl-CoA dehydrogenase